MYGGDQSMLENGLDGEQVRQLPLKKGITQTVVIKCNGVSSSPSLRVRDRSRAWVGTAGGAQNGSREKRRAN